MTRSQQEELYRAQKNVPLGLRLTTDEAQRFVDDLRETEWWRRLYWMVERVEVVKLDRRHTRSLGSWHPESESGLIELTAAGHRLRTVVHELAHVLANARYPVAGMLTHGHDPVFARTYAELVYRVMGSEAWLKLREGYHAHGVDYQESVSS